MTNKINSSEIPVQIFLHWKKEVKNRENNTFTVKTTQCRFFAQRRNNRRASHKRARGGIPCCELGDSCRVKCGRGNSWGRRCGLWWSVNGHNEVSADRGYLRFGKLWKFVMTVATYFLRDPGMFCRTLSLPFLFNMIMLQGDCELFLLASHIVCLL